MALFTDGPIHASGELQAYDTNVLTVASTEGIDLTSKIRLAQDEIATELLLTLRRNATNDPRRHIRTRIGLGDIVVTAPLKRWHAYKTLELVYRDAYNNQLNDRYQGKRTEYKQLSRNAAETLFEAGVGMVHHPVPKAGPPVVTSVTANVSGMQYYVRISWINTLGQEGAVSDLAQITTDNGSSVTIGSPNTPTEIGYWNVYAGTDPHLPCRQNNTPLPAGATWTPLPAGLTAGPTPGEGQAPEWWFIERHILQRG